MVRPIAGFLVDFDTVGTLTYLLRRHEKVENNPALVHECRRLREQIEAAAVPNADGLHAGVQPLALGGALGDDLLTAEQVARMTHTDSSTVRRRCAAGDYGRLAARVGGVWILHRNAVEVTP